MIAGQDAALTAFRSAWDSRRIHHAWLLTGPRGTGKASFARAAARRLLADAVGPIGASPGASPGGSPVLASGLAVPGDHPVARLLAAGSHPDFRWLERLERPSGGLARNISVEQVR